MTQALCRITINKNPGVLLFEPVPTGLLVRLSLADEILYEHTFRKGETGHCSLWTGHWQVLGSGSEMSFHNRPVDPDDLIGTTGYLKVVACGVGRAEVRATLVDADKEFKVAQRLAMDTLFTRRAYQ